MTPLWEKPFWRGSQLLGAFFTSEAVGARKAFPRNFWIPPSLAYAEGSKNCLGAFPKPPLQGVPFQKIAEQASLRGNAVFCPRKRKVGYRRFRRSNPTFSLITREKIFDPRNTLFRPSQGDFARIRGFQSNFLQVEGAENWKIDPSPGDWGGQLTRLPPYNRKP